MRSFRSIAPLASYTRIIGANTFRSSIITSSKLYSSAHHAEEIIQPSGTFLKQEDVQERILNIVRAHERVDQSKLNAQSNFYNDLGLDSLDAAEIVHDVEDEFSLEIPDEEAFKIVSVPDAVKYISSNPLAK